VAAGAFILVLGITGFGFYQYKHQPQRFLALTDCYQKLTNWMTERKHHLNQSIQVVKQIAVKDAAEQPVHFEFYTALPNMKMELATAENLNSSVSAPAPKKVLPTTAATAVPDTKITALSPAVATLAEIKTKSPFVSPEELERQMSRELDTSTQYVLQLGVFRAADAAQKLRSALVAAGFHAVVSKMAGKDRELYRVQLGPYLNKSQAIHIQGELQKRGMDSVVRKVELS
jgi:cell division protein FtsN